MKTPEITLITQGPNCAEENISFFFIFGDFFVCFVFSPSDRIGELPFLLQEFAPRVVVMYFIAAVAFLFYISKVPERYFPGRKFSSGCFFCS